MGQYLRSCFRLSTLLLRVSQDTSLMRTNAHHPPACHPELTCLDSWAARLHFRHRPLCSMK